MRAPYIFLLLCVMLLAGGRARPAQAAPATVEAYRQLVTEAYAAAQRSDRIGLDERAEQLLAITEIQMPDGSTAPLDNSWLQDALASEPPDYPLIVTRLGAILDAFGQPRTPPDADALNKLAQVYEVPPFKDRELPSAWDRFWSAIGRAIVRFFEQLFGSLPATNPVPTPNGTSFTGMSPTGWAVLLIGLLLVLTLIVYVVRGVRHSVVSDAKAKAEAEEREFLSAAEAIDQAQSAALAGNYRSAARSLYLSSLLWLEERGMLRYDRSRTNREYLQQLRGKPSHDALVPVVDTFEQVWYGHRPLDANDFSEYQRKVEALRSLETQRATEAQRSGEERST